MPRILRNYLICFAVIGAALFVLDLVDAHFQPESPENHSKAHSEQDSR